MLEIKLGDCNEKGERIGKRKITFKGTHVSLMQDTYEVTCVLLNNFLFKRLDVSKKDKFEILDSFLESIKKTCEQEICLGDGD